MSCDYPRHAYQIKGGISFEKPSGHSGATIKIPCKICTGCRLDHRTNWSTRMMHEASFNDHNQFVTFTYNDENLPKNGDLQEADMRNFFKRLRKEFPPKTVRYVYSSEYGGKYSRPHYHAIIFGLELTDLIRKASNDRGDPLYSSEFLEKIWTHGNTTTGHVNHKTCAYVAGYMLKDSLGNYKKTATVINPKTGKCLVDSITGKPVKKAIPYTTTNLDTGESTERKRPFARYSNRPGIGKKWIEKYYKSVFPRDNIRTYEGNMLPMPDYYFDQLKKLDPAMHAQVQAKRDAAVIDKKVVWNNTPDRKKVRATCRDAKISRSGRGAKPDQNHTIYIQGES